LSANPGLCDITPLGLRKRIPIHARAQYISFAELCRRGLERYARQWAADIEEKTEIWEYPTLSANEMDEDAVLERQEAMAS